MKKIRIGIVGLGPRGIHVFRLAHEKVGAENFTRKELLEGKTLQEVYRKYGAL